MSATSGIGISEELAETYSAAIVSGDVRFVKVVIRDERLVPESTTPLGGSLDEDLEKLQELLEDAVPAYILACVDPLKSEWLAISYVPDVAKVREKMLYASTRNTLTKSLGSTHFTDSLFATSKNDVTPSSYAAHRAHMSAPKPMSVREQEAEAARAAERQAGNAAYESLHDRSRNEPVGFAWPDEVDSAMKNLAEGEESHLVILSLDIKTENLLLNSSEAKTVEEVPSSLSKSDPCYAFFAWKHDNRRDVVFIYSCPTSSPVKYRMMYSSGSLAVRLKAKEYFTSGTSVLMDRRLETSDPAEINEELLTATLGSSSIGVAASSGITSTDEKKPFARPKGPGRKR